MDPNELSFVSITETRIGNESVHCVPFLAKQAVVSLLFKLGKQELFVFTSFRTQPKQTCQLEVCSGSGGDGVALPDSLTVEVSWKDSLHSLF